MQTEGVLTKANSLLKHGDTTTVAVIVGTSVGSFLLGILVPVVFFLIRRTRPTSPPVDSKTEIYRHSTIQRPENDIYDHAPLSPRSLSHTFARYSLKPSMNMFSKKERIEWSGVGEQRSPQAFEDYTDPFGSFGQKPFSSVTSEDVALHGRDVLPQGHRNSDGSPDRITAVIEDTHGRQTLTLGRQRLSRSGSESTVQESDPKMDSSVFAARVGQDERSTPPGLWDSQKLQPQKTPSDPQLAYPGRAKTQYDISAHKFGRLRSLLSPQPRSERSGRSNITTVGVPRYEPTRWPQLKIVDPSGVTAAGPDSSQEPYTASSIVTEQDSDLTRQTSQRQAVAFYQRHATRHLSLPQGAPLSSRVLPDSPCGVIGNGDGSPRRNFSIV